MPDSITLHFQRERNTKRMVRYQEQTAEGREPLIRTLYVSKAWADGAARITVTIEKTDAHQDR